MDFKNLRLLPAEEPSKDELVDIELKIDLGSPVSPNNVIPIAPEELPPVVDPDDSKGANELTSSLVQIQAEDYGGSIALPHYGYKRPSADYFNSNLMAYNFVVSDISADKNIVYYYDERHQGKGADALCSLRMRYHLRK